MKRWIAGSLLFCVTQGVMAQTHALPTVYFEAAGSLDLFACHAQTPVTESMLDKLVKRVPEFEQTWQEYGPNVLQIITDLTQHTFESEHQELNVGLFLCNDKGSLAFPALVNIVPYFGASKADFPKQVFTATVLDVMLIRFLNQNYPTLMEESALLQRYENESNMVKHSLHVFALLKYAYLVLHKEADLDDVIKSSAEFTDPGVARAWDIISRETGYQPFVDEILSLN